VVAPLECRDLSRSYGAVLGLEGLHLTLAAGEIFGLIGLNGAGKSTTLRLALGLLKPTRGEALLFGVPARRALAARRRLGYVPSELSLYPDRSARESLDLLARLTGSTPAAVRSSRLVLAARLGMNELDLDRPVGEMSHGMRQKVGIVQALEHGPDFVVLDEPSDGLDPVARDVLATLLGEVRERGGTVLLASHVLSEIEGLADRVGVLHRGKLVALETAASLRRREALLIEASFAGELPPLDGVGGIEVVERGAGRLVLRAHPPLDAVVKLLARGSLQMLRVHEPSLEDLVREVAREDTP